jgi:hypothetical protein
MFTCPFNHRAFADRAIDIHAGGHPRSTDHRTGCCKRCHVE